jgi:predicted TIM-barrel fold metal-dependent hydrolase
VLRRHANVCIETSGVYRQDFIEDVARDIGPQRVLFGSSAPRMDIRLEVERIRWAKVPDADRTLMLAENARQLFRLDSSAPRS